MPASQCIEQNLDLLREVGVPQEVIETVRKVALDFASKLPTKP